MRLHTTQRLFLPPISAATSSVRFEMRSDVQIELCAPHPSNSSYNHNI